jgi:hypothetical protein
MAIAFGSFEQPLASAPQARDLPTSLGPQIGKDCSMEICLQTVLLAAAGYSLVYLLAKGGIVGAILIFIIAKLLGR